jgi:putative membrane protein
VSGSGLAHLSSEATGEHSMSDDDLANDRTFLAWLRTDIAVMGLGFVVAKVALIVEPTNEAASDQDLYAVAGILIVLCGGVLVVVGYLWHKTVLESLRTDKAKPPPRWPLTITATAVACALLLSVLIAVST